ncbi:ExeM/NucH family extracellular endonuclease [Pseudoduganella sp. OTU4001]|uniref:ExeM/NucH family extracellular endonuclease n=1 Tax=Pseudoduganella sp. OTU4001 TaxID=3043854 RepID=UPI00313E0670
MTTRFVLRATACAAALLASLGASAADVVISQVYGAGGNGGALLKSDYVELFNRGSVPQSLNGWSLQYASSSGSSWTNMLVLSDVTLQPGQYYLVRLATNASGSGSDLLDYNQSGSIPMAAAAGKIALVSNTTPMTVTNPANPRLATLLDLVGYGTGTNGFEGATGPTPSISTTLAAFRAGNGCTDTDNNAGDFTVATPAPRHMNSPLNVCSGGGTPALPIVPACPASASLTFGAGGSIPLSASDADGIVNGATITSAAVPGLSLGALTAAGAIGGSASVSLVAAPNVAAGTYPVAVKFTNGQGQNASCTVNVSVELAAGTVLPVYQVQGSGATSPFAGVKVTTEGVVTAKVGSGYFIQDATGDGDPTTSDGMFVYMAASPVTVAVGDLVRVTGTVTEYKPSGATRSYTELASVTSTVVQSSGHAIMPQNIDLLGTNLADVEGMLVRLNGELTVNANESLGSRGELTLAVGRREIPTNRYAPRSAEAIAMAAANAANMITLDDGIFVTPATVPYIGEDGTVRTGDTVSGLTGVIDFGALGSGGAGFKLQPTETPVFSRANPRTAAPDIVAGNVRVASANVLNFFTTFVDGKDVTGASGQGCELGGKISASNCRGANNMQEFVRQRDKIVAKLKAIDADVVGLMEIQNNGDYAASYLVDALNTAYGKVEYAYVPKPVATGTDAIRVAMIYKPGKLALVGNALSDANAVNDRPPMAQTFKANNGAKFSLIVNHLKSKRCSGASGANADKGDGQSCFNGDRMAQAQQLVNVFVPQVKAAAGDDDVLLIGDMNSYGMEDPIQIMTAAGFENQLERFVRPVTMPHSYVFGGESGYLDHALASTSLSAQVAGATEWNVNADEPEVLDYNLEDKNAAALALYNALPYRASDHDPVVIALNLDATYSDVTAGMLVQRAGLVQSRGSSVATGNVWVTNNSGAALAGPVHYLVPGLPAGVTLANASGAVNGVPYITVAPSLAAGAQVAFQVKFNNPAKAAINYVPQVLTGSF